MVSFSKQVLGDNNKKYCICILNYLYIKTELKYWIFWNITSKRAQERKGQKKNPAFYKKKTILFSTVLTVYKKVNMAFYKESNKPKPLWSGCVNGIETNQKEKK